MLVQKGIDPSTDFEPEYIAVSGDKAYISLQEANAIAELNISAGEFVGVYPLGFQDYSVTEIDLQKNDNIELKNYPDVYGIKMPDGISVTQIDGKTYILTANEGDSVPIGQVWTTNTKIKLRPRVMLHLKKKRFGLTQICGTVLTPIKPMYSADARFRYMRRQTTV